MKPLFTLFLWVILLHSASAQQLLWYARGGGVGADWTNWAAVDLDDNIYTVGSYNAGGGGTVNFGPHTLSGPYQLYIAKLNPGGDFIWVRRITTVGTGFERVTQVATDHFGHIYISGEGNNAPITFGSITVNCTDNFLAKYDSSGNALWALDAPGNWLQRITTDIHGNVFAYGSSWDSVQSIGNFSFVRQGGNSSALLVKIDPAGSPLWAKSIWGEDVMGGALSADRYGQISITGMNYTTAPYLWFDSLMLTAPGLDFLAKYDGNGNLLFAKALTTQSILDQNFPDPTIHHDAMGNIYVASLVPDSVRHITSISRYDSQGNFVWQRTGSNTFRHCDFIVDAVGNSFITGDFWSSMQFDSVSLTATQGDYVFKFDQFGNAVWGKDMHNTVYTDWKKLVIDSKGDIILAGTQDANAQDAFISKFRDLTAPRPGSITGKVFADFIANCTLDSAETPVATVLVKAMPGNYYASADTNGDYVLKTDLGSYTITPVFTGFRQTLVESYCPANRSVMLDTSTVSSQDADFGLKAVACPLLSVSVSSSVLRRCFSGTTAVRYANEGFVPADSVQVHVTFPPELIFQYTTQPYLLSGSSTYTFNIGTLQAGQEGTIILRHEVSCDNIETLGLTQCIEASITPVYSCATPDTTWNGASLIASVVCKDAYAILKVDNTGAGDMTDSVECRIFLDAVLSAKRMIWLQAGDSILMQVFPNQHTVRFEVDQVANHPHNRMVSATLENCRRGEAGNVSLGVVNQFPQNDEEPNRDVDCSQIVGSYDPNDKQVSPSGIGATHGILPSTLLEYKVRFQNTGTDTAFKVVVVDTLSPHVDVRTFQPGVSSHPYTLSVSGHGVLVLTFTFDNILLPDSTTDLAGSQGFLKFEIAPYDTLPLGTVLENFADIYFDFNPPVRTNVVFNTISIPAAVQLDNSIAQVCGESVVAVAGLDTILCGVDSYVLNALHPLAGHGLWQLVQGDAAIETFDSAITVVSGLGYGENVFSYTVTLCNSTDTDEVIVDRYNIPTPEIILAGDSLTTQSQGPIYKWYWNGILLNTDAKTIPLDAHGIYTLVVEDKFCASQASAAFSYTHAGFEPSAGVVICPNPGNGMFNVTIKGQLQGITTISVADVNGNILLNEKAVSGKGPLERAIDLSFLPKGMYFLKVENAGSVKYGKLVIL